MWGRASSPVQPSKGIDVGMGVPARPAERSSAEIHDGSQAKAALAEYHRR